MNIAFPAFFLLALILPGFIFLSAFSRSENTKLDHRAFDSSSASALFISSIIHSIWMLLSQCLADPVDLELVIKLLTGAKLSKSEYEQLAHSAPLIAQYFFSAYLFSWFSGRIFQSAVMKFSPYKDSRFSFDTPWYYELKGFLSKEQDAQLLELSCLCESQEGSYLYYGILEDFYLDNDGQLDRVVLSSAYRRKLSDDDKNTNGEKAITPKAEDKRYYRVRGDRLMLKYSNMANLNIEYTYFYSSETTASQ